MTNSVQAPNKITTGGASVKTVVSKIPHAKKGSMRPSGNNGKKR